MNSELINSQEVKLPFIYKRHKMDVEYLVSYDKYSGIDKKINNFIFIELGDGFVFSLSKKEFEKLLLDNEGYIMSLDKYEQIN